MTLTRKGKIRVSGEAWRKCGGTAPFGGHGTKQNLRFRGSLMEVENDLGGTISFGGRGTERNLKSGERVAERPPPLDVAVVSFVPYLPLV